LDHPPVADGGCGEAVGIAGEQDGSRKKENQGLEKKPGNAVSVMMFLPMMMVVAMAGINGCAVHESQAHDGGHAQQKKKTSGHRCEWLE
jgi:hypothetical protein